MIHILYNKAAKNAMTEIARSSEMSRLYAIFDQRLMLLAAAAALALLGLAGLDSSPAEAAPTFVACGGAAMLGGAQLNCSHLAPKKPAQLCNFSWSLLLPNNVPQVVSGSFLLPQGANNAIVYQGTGFVGSLSAPIILCSDQH